MGLVSEQLFYCRIRWAHALLDLRDQNQIVKSVICIILVNDWILKWHELI